MENVNIGMLLIGVIAIVMGLINMTGNVGTIHSYNRLRVKEEDVLKYGRTIGLGTTIIGLGLVFGSLVPHWQAEYIKYIVFIPTIIGIAIILFAQFKYNKGIF